jgi:hypothetical protein
MNEVRLRPVTYTDLSALRHGVAVSETPPFHTPEFLVIRYFGSYRSGADGKPDALYIVATAAAAREAWWCPSTILDFRALEYHWGDNMEWVTGVTWDKGLRLAWPLAVVVGDGCRKALRSLLRERYEGLCVESLEEAFALCRRKAEEHRQQLRERRGLPAPGAAPDPPRDSGSGTS